jgi:group II intron reverse transcriptase/maturase
MIVIHRLHRLVRLAKADPSKRFDRLFREVAKADFLMFAFEQIKDNKGSGTPGVDGQTKTDWSYAQAEELARSLRDGTYTPTPVRRVYIPKKSGKLRPLGIPTFADRVVQCALKLILEALYEPVFLDCSHGFRPRRGCHTALAAVYDNPKVRIDWVVEGDIQGCFDNVNHHILIRLLQRRIADDRLLQLIAQFLQAGYFEREEWNPTKAGTPQGGVLSPLLANIYLHELDQYVLREFGANQEPSQSKQETAQRENPEWKRIHGRINYIRAMLDGRRKAVGNADDLRAELRALLKQRKATPHLSRPIKPRITYVRYADDFVIVLRSLPKTEAERIKAKLTAWVAENLRLVLSPEKTAITHITDGFTFLGYKFLSKKGDTGTQPRVKLTIPYESVNAKIELIRDICRSQSQPEVEAIRRINSVLRGWMAYYSCATAPSRAFYRLLSQAWSLYGSYVSRKHDCHIGAAAKRWMTRCPASPENPKGGQKTWMAETSGHDGQPRREYLLCWTPPKRSLRDVAAQIYRGKFDLWYLLSREVTQEYLESRVQ